MSYAIRESPNTASFENSDGKKEGVLCGGGGGGGSFIVATDFRFFSGGGGLDGASSGVTCFAGTSLKIDTP